MNAPHKIVSIYCQAWNEQDEEARRSLLIKAWADDGLYSDPKNHLSGREALIQHIRNMQRLRPGAQIKLTSSTDWHHAFLRFEWKLIGPKGETLKEGIDFGELDADGRLKSIIGFFGEIPMQLP